MARRLALAAMLVLAALMGNIVPARAALHGNNTARSHSSAKSRSHSHRATQVRCTAAAPLPKYHHGKATRRAPAKKERTSSSCTGSFASRSRIASPLFRRHLVGDLFGVGTFVTQRSWTISRLLIMRTRQLGAQWVREEFTASELHSTTAGKYSWEPYDRIVNEERRAGLHVLGLLDYSNTWSFQDHASVPHAAISRVSTDFARYAFEMARHFRGRIAYWQVWNEPNTEQFWQPFPAAADYATLVTSAARAIKRADPHAHVVLAGVSGMDLSFVRDVAARTHAFDVVAVHPYRSLPEPSFARQAGALQALRRPVWFSEIGWAAGNGCHECYDETEQARYLVRFYTLAAAAGIQRVFWYDLRDDVQPATDPEAHFGLVRRDLSVKPAFAAYELLSRLLTGSTFIGADLSGAHGLYAFQFAGRNSNVTIVWNASDTTRQVSIPWAHSYAQLLNASGDVLAELGAASGHVSITAPQGGEPFYLVDRVPTYRLAPAGPLLHAAPPPPPPAPPHQPQRPGGTHARTHAPTAAWVAPARDEKRKARSSPSRTEHTVRIPAQHTPTPPPKAKSTSIPSP